MSALTNVQIINGIDGNPAFVVIPYADYLKEHAANNATIPNEVVGAVIKQDITPIKAWREYLHLSTAELATDLGISEAEYIDIENQDKPRRNILKKVATALRITVAQLTV
ncbi:helix-turn-helix domain-containing protein [Methylomonas sp. MED-D]|uniref:Transcriptional regulator n=1 Tax=Methylomonas koyamae TaxID=702114 RepID=A0A177NZA6_9GAMM|nr:MULTISPECIES: helix-turn-helix transcriptional regulator [Methylomonas]MDT4330977.1 helix-turn-helix transcriptional regulator [Methylomonas sp. MV1]OAI23345.1 transcriptional regulator [Methylomonas koyamae]OHX34131.1 transcriptional regulator [Methylomonas sp. LWB]WGS84872.1 helix-turn-helix transcriptional regulator [Methylomonas sp. UP202]